MDVVEIVVRFGGALLHVTQIAPGAGFRIGTAPDVDLALDIAPLTSFPLVDGYVVRCPAGIPAAVYTADRSITVAESELALERGTRIDLAFGSVMLSITRIARVRAPLARPRASFRPHLFAAVSLVMHLVIVVVAMQLGEPEAITIPAFREPVPRPPTQLVQLPTEKQKARMRERAKRAAAATGAATTPAERAITEARTGGIFRSLTPERLGGLMGSKNLAKELADVGPLYRDYEAEAKQFGGASRWDVSGPGFNSVKTGRYATNPNSGADYDLGAVTGRKTRVAMCETPACVIAGAIDSTVVRGELEGRLDEIVACYDRHAPKATRGSVVLTFAITADGTAEAIRTVGLGSVAGCVANVVRSIRFPAGAAITQVKYPLAFSRG